MIVYDGTKMDIPVEITNNTNDSKKLSFLNLSSIEIKPGETIKYKAESSEQLVEILYKSKESELETSDGTEEINVPIINMKLNNLYSMKLRKSIDNIDKLLTFLRSTKQQEDTGLYVIGMEFKDRDSNEYMFFELDSLPIAIVRADSSSGYTYLSKDYFNFSIESGMIEGYPEEFKEDGWYYFSTDSIKPVDISVLNNILENGIRITKFHKINSLWQDTEVDEISSEDIEYILSYLEPMNILTVVIDEDPKNVGKSSMNFSDIRRGINFRQMSVILGEPPYKYTLKGKDRDKLEVRVITDSPVN